MAIPSGLSKDHQDGTVARHRSRISRNDAAVRVDHRASGPTDGAVKGTVRLALLCGCTVTPVTLPPLRGYPLNPRVHGGALPAMTLQRPPAVF
jgi:hypothetical protein